MWRTVCGAMAAGCVISTLALSAEQVETHGLGTLPEEEYRAAFDKFREGLKEKETISRIVAVKDFGVVKDARVLDELRKLLNGRDKDLQKTALDVLTGVRDPRAFAALEQSLPRLSHDKEDSALLAKAVTALGAANHIPAAAKINGLLEHDDPAVKEAAFNAMSSIVPAQYVSHMIKVYEDDKKKAEKNKIETERENYARILNAEGRALSTITGERYYDAAAYRKWWGVNRGLFKPYGGMKEGATPKAITVKKDKDSL